jgi:hypothetical protein
LSMTRIPPAPFAAFPRAGHFLKNIREILLYKLDIRECPSCTADPHEGMALWPTAEGPERAMAQTRHAGMKKKRSHTVCG